MNQEKKKSVVSGWLMLFVGLGIIIFSVYLKVTAIMSLDSGNGGGFQLAFGIVSLLVGIFTLIGLFILQPNQAGAVILFGSYQGTVKKNGFWWRNPFAAVKKISLRARNNNTEKLKVNDKRGNPIEIGAVLVWKVENTAQALFDVDDFEEYVDIQSEAALRHLAGKYPYDSGEDEEISLRGGQEDINDELLKELQERLGRAGVIVMEARISHLAYAPEIAGAMLRRQQAEAVIAARKRIVEGAVSMVEMALDGLKEKNVVELDEERKASMVSNLLVVLCSEEGARPVVNAGTLYH